MDDRGTPRSCIRPHRHHPANPGNPTPRACPARSTRVFLLDLLCLPPSHWANLQQCHRPFLPTHLLHRRTLGPPCYINMSVPTPYRRRNPGSIHPPLSQHSSPDTSNSSTASLWTNIAGPL